MTTRAFSRASWACLLLLWARWGPANAFEGGIPSDPAPAIAHAQFERVPTGADFVRAYPEQAQRRGVEGRAKIACTVLADYALGNCVVTEEEPTGYDFGAAALRLAASFRLKPLTSDGKSTVGGTFRTSISFRLAPKAAAPR